MAKWKRENHTGCIHKLKGKRRKPWVARGPMYKKDGYFTRDYIGTFKTYEEASEALKMAKGVALNLTHNTSMDEIFSILYAKKEKQGLTESSLDAVKTHYNHIKELGNNNFVDLSTYDFQKIIDKLIDGGSSFSKVSKIKSTVKQLYDVAIENKLLHVNYAQFLDVSRAEEGKVYPFPEEDIEILFRNDRDRIAKASLILAYTGFRIGEFLSLDKFKNIDLKKCCIIGGSKTDAGKDRIVPIHNKIKNYVEYFYYEFPETSLFFSRDGARVSSDYYRKYYHNPLIKRLGLSPYTPHSFRHTFATKMRMAELSDKVMESLIGHTDASFTDKRYIDLPASYLLTEINKLA